MVAMNCTRWSCICPLQFHRNAQLGQYPELHYLQIPQMRGTWRLTSHATTPRRTAASLTLHRPAAGRRGVSTTVWQYLSYLLAFSNCANAVVACVRRCAAHTLPVGESIPRREIPLESLILLVAQFSSSIHPTQISTPSICTSLEVTDP